MMVCLDVGKVKIPILKEINNFYFFKIVPIIGKILIQGEEMFDYLPNSSIDYPDQKKLKEILIEIGFVDVKIYNFIFGASTIHIAFKPEN